MESGAGAQRESASAALCSCPPTTTVSAGPVHATPPQGHPVGLELSDGVLPGAHGAAALQLLPGAKRAAPAETPAPEPPAHSRCHLLGARGLPRVLRALSRQPPGIHAHARGACGQLWFV